MTILGKPRTKLRLAGTAAVVVGLTATALTGCGTNDGEASDSTATSSQSAPVTSEDTAAVADWLAGEVGANGFVEGQFVDHGLTLDFARALSRTGGHDDVADRTLEAMTDPREVEGYLSFYDEKKNGRYAGATAKLIYTVVAADRDLAAYREGLVEDLTAMVVETGPEAGRAKDTGPTDYSNTIGQAYVVRALAITETQDELAGTLEFLLDQQCDDGWFRESLEAGPDGEHRCEAQQRSERTPSVDATAHALMALLEVAGQVDGRPRGSGRRVGRRRDPVAGGGRSSRTAASPWTGLRGRRTPTPPGSPPML